MLYHALSIKDNIITGVFDSDKPITEDVLSGNPAFSGHEIIQIKDKSEYQTGQSILAYTPNGTLRPLIDRVQDGLAEVPSGYELIDGELVAIQVTEVDAPVSLMERLIAAEAKTRLLLEVVKDTLTDAQAVKNKNIYPRLMTLVGQEVKAGQKVRYGDDLFKIDKSHRVSADILPDSKEAFGLYSKVLPPDAPHQEEPTAGDYPIWAATGIYNIGDEVVEGGKVYKSLKDMNWDKPSETAGKSWEYLFDL